MGKRQTLDETTGISHTRGVAAMMLNNPATDHEQAIAMYVHFMFEYLTYVYGYCTAKNLSMLITRIAKFELLPNNIAVAIAILQNTCGL